MRLVFIKNKQQQRQNSQRYDALYIVSEKEEDIMKMKGTKDKLKFKEIGNESRKTNKDSISDTSLGYIFLKTLISSNKTHRLSQDMGWVSFMCLLSTFMTSILAYLTRSFIFYHRIADKYTNKLFSPFHVYCQIRKVGDEMPEALFMLERVNWTYTLIMHILEDIPQLFASSIFLSYYGNDFYAFFMITWSSCMIITTSIRMGISYPLIGTLSLIFSRKPPVDSPTLNEATTTTLHFPLFMAAITFIWAVSDSLCLYFTHGFWTILFYFGLTANILASTLFILYYVHLSKQASAYTRQLNSLYFTEDFSRIQSRHF
ncbi:predicted integral membrane protein, possible [Cryptosporidium parvum]|uniref:Predicted integral membrane protein, possible n=1 Tax=Cryptosporidium parvum TaxID=5807 RepID=A0A7G2HKE1_CRYPV|nr:predicted integral membrane protein, possible [Cryptosporidium parvum]